MTNTPFEMQFPYRGSEPTLMSLYAALGDVHRLLSQLNLVVDVVKQLKGMLNEKSYEDRLAAARYCDGSLVLTIVVEQEARRAEYHRTRMMLKHHLIPRLTEHINRALELAEKVRDGLRPKEPTYSYASQVPYAVLWANHTAMGRVQLVIRQGKALEALVNASAVVEDDATNGRAKASFDQLMASILNGHWYSGVHDLLPIEVQVLDQVGPHAATRNLFKYAGDLLPELKAWRQKIDEFLHVASHRRHQDARPVTFTEKLLYPEYFVRTNSYLRVHDGYLEGLVKLQNEAMHALSEISSEGELFLAQSNVLGAFAYKSMMLSLHADAHNNTVCGGNGSEVYLRDALQTFDSFMATVRPQTQS